MSECSEFLRTIIWHIFLSRSKNFRIIKKSPDKNISSFSQKIWKLFQLFMALLLWNYWKTKIKQNLSKNGHVIILNTMVFQSLIGLTLREKCPNTELFLVRIQSKCGKIFTIKNVIFGHFPPSVKFLMMTLLLKW